MPDALRVVVADDHVPTRAGVTAALRRGGIEVVAEAASAPAAVAAALAHRPDACLLDVEMPGNGIEAAREIAERLPGTPVVMLTVSERPADLFAALEAGALGYLLKDTDPDRLPSALRGVIAGEAAIPRGLVAHLVQEFRRREAPGPRGARAGSALTEREAEVLARLREGRTTKEISLELGLSAVTVRRHVSRLMAKLGVTDRDAAVRAVEDDR